MSAFDTPIFTALFAESDDETQRLVLEACADEHTAPVVTLPTKGRNKPRKRKPRPSIATRLVDELGDLGNYA